ncbi:MAG: rod shape-determining protein MreD [bacterium]|nr:rod shape-determining protein MreD [bacterium]
MSKLLMLAVVIISVVLKITLFRFIEFGSYKPDILLIIVVFISIYEGPLTGASLGFIGGLTEDILGSGYLGLFTVSKTLIGFALGIIGKHIYKTGIYPYAIAAFAASVFQEFFIFFWLKMFQPYASFFGSSFRNIILPLVIYNTILTPFVVLGLKKIFRTK